MLNGKQKRYLRALGTTEKAIILIGKEDLSANLLDSIEKALKARELIKISILKSCSLTIREVAISLAASTNSEIVQIIGRTILLYRKSKKRIITLP